MGMFFPRPYAQIRCIPYALYLEYQVSVCPPSFPPVYRIMAPGVQPSPIRLMSSVNFLLVIFLPPPAPPSGACSSGS